MNKIYAVFPCEKGRSFLKDLLFEKQSLMNCTRHFSSFQDRKIIAKKGIICFRDVTPASIAGTIITVNLFLSLHFNKNYRR